MSVETRLNETGEEDGTPLGDRLVGARAPEEDIDGLMLRDGSPYYWIGNGCELSLPALWLARLSDTAMIDRSYGLFPDLKQTADGCRFSAERGLKALPADQSWNRECLRLGMPYRHLIGGVPYYSWLSLWKLTAKDPALQQIFAPQGHSLFADIGNETGWEATRLVIRNRLKYNNFAPPFALELSREPGYAPTGERMISGFRQYARRKYGTLEKANRAWKTTFSSWEQIYPLHLRPDLKSESIHKLRELTRTDLHIVLDLRRDEEVNTDPQHKYESQRYDHFDCLAQN